MPMEFEDKHKWLIQSKFIGVPNEHPAEIPNLLYSQVGLPEEAQIPDKSNCPRSDPIAIMVQDLEPQISQLREKTDSAFEQMKNTVQ